MVEIAEAQVRLPELVTRAGKGEEIILMDQGKQVARVVAAAPAPMPRIAGLQLGNVVSISDDFDEPLPEDFWLGDET
jgi:antitoxin (DNA-binding transcriptional repressor) of toxin-antitoxin stability system